MQRALQSRSAWRKLLTCNIRCVCRISQALKIEVGLSFLTNISGKLFQKSQVTLHDVNGNTAVTWLHSEPIFGNASDIFRYSLWSEAIEVVMTVSRGTGRFSSLILQEAILAFYKEEKLLPKGLVSSMESVQLWALKMGRALQRLVSWH